MITEIHDYLRLLLRPSRWHTPCVRRGPVHRRRSRSSTACAPWRHALPGPLPVVRGREGKYQDSYRELRALARELIIDGEMARLENAPKLEKKLKHNDRDRPCRARHASAPSTDSVGDGCASDGSSSSVDRVDLDPEDPSAAAAFSGEARLPE